MSNRPIKRETNVPANIPVTDNAGNTIGKVDPSLIIAVIMDALGLVGWKQMTPKARVAAITALVVAIAALVLAIVS